jgi:hypothetical protein
VRKELFVADYGLDAVEVPANKTWQNIGSITSGIDNPDGGFVDKNGNIVICDQNNSTVDVIAPPYSSISGYLGSGYSDPLHVRIGKHDKLACIDNFNYGAASVWVKDYPSGSVIAALGSTNGPSAPIAAVDGNNEVP